MSFADRVHSWSLRLGYDEPHDPRRIPVQRRTARIDCREMKDTIRSATGMGNIIDYANSDESYKLVDIDYLKDFLRLNPVNKRNYVPIKHDCDDFAYLLMGDVTRWDSDLAFGIVWGHTHAWNFFVDTDKKVWQIEPQNDTIFDPADRVVRLMV